MRLPSPYWPDEEIWNVHLQLKRKFLTFARERGRHAQEIERLIDIERRARHAERVGRPGSGLCAEREGDRLSRDRVPGGVGELRARLDRIGDIPRRHSEVAKPRRNLRSAVLPVGGRLGTGAAAAIALAVVTSAIGADVDFEDVAVGAAGDFLEGHPTGGTA